MPTDRITFRPGSLEAPLIQYCDKHQISPSDALRNGLALLLGESAPVMKRGPRPSEPKPPADKPDREPEALHTSVARRAPGQAKCVWCGKWLRDQQPCLTHEEKVALRDYARSFGRFWKRRLTDEWANGCFHLTGNVDTAALLRVRNKIGPSGLDRLSTDRVLTYGKKAVIR